MNTKLELKRYLNRTMFWEKHCTKKSDNLAQPLGFGGHQSTWKKSWVYKVLG